MGQDICYGWIEDTLRACQSEPFFEPTALYGLSFNHLGHRELVNSVLENARREGFIGAGLEACILLHTTDDRVINGLERLQKVIRLHNRSRSREPFLPVE